MPYRRLAGEKAGSLNQKDDPSAVRDIQFPIKAPRSSRQKDIKIWQESQSQIGIYLYFYIDLP